MQLQIELPDGSKKEYDKGVTFLDIAKSRSFRMNIRLNS